MARRIPKFWPSGDGAKSAHPKPTPVVADPGANPTKDKKVIRFFVCTACAVHHSEAELVGSCSHYGLVCPECDVKERTAKYGAAYAAGPPPKQPKRSEVPISPKSVIRPAATTMDTLTSMEALAAAAGQVLPSDLASLAQGFERGIGIVKKMMKRQQRR